MNIGVIGKRGSGKTTWAHRLVGLEPPARPLGTATLNYLACAIDGQDVLVWDFPPGICEHTKGVLNNMDWVAICYDGDTIDHIAEAVHQLAPAARLMVLVTSRHIGSVLHLCHLHNGPLARVPVCLDPSQAWECL